MIKEKLRFIEHTNLVDHEHVQFRTIGGFSCLLFSDVRIRFDLLQLWLSERLEDEIEG